MVLFGLCYRLIQFIGMYHINLQSPFQSFFGLIDYSTWFEKKKKCWRWTMIFSFSWRTFSFQNLNDMPFDWVSDHIGLFLGHDPSCGLFEPFWLLTSHPRSDCRVVSIVSILEPIFLAKFTGRQRVLVTVTIEGVNVHWSTSHAFVSFSPIYTIFRCNEVEMIPGRFDAAKAETATFSNFVLRRC